MVHKQRGRRLRCFRLKTKPIGMRALSFFLYLFPEGDGGKNGSSLFRKIALYYSCANAEHCRFDGFGKEHDMKGRMDTQLGEVIIDPDVIATYAGSVAVECFGIVGMAAVNVRDGLVKLLRSNYLKHGINVKIENNMISLDFHVLIVYGVSIKTVAANLIDNVRYKVEEFTGMKLDRVRIIVEGVRVID